MDVGLKVVNGAVEIATRGGIEGDDLDSTGWSQVSDAELQNKRKIALTIWFKATPICQ